MGACQDITEFRRAEAAELREHELRRAEIAIRVVIAEMDRFTDLQRVVHVIHLKLIALGLEHDTASIQVVNTEGTDFITFALGTHEPVENWQQILGKLANTSWPKASDHAERFPWVIEAWKTGACNYQPDTASDDLRQLGTRSQVDVPFSHGTLAISSGHSAAFAAADIALLERFARVLSDGFRRFLDLLARERA